MEHLLKMDEEEVLNKLEKSCFEDFYYYGNKNKSERERWVVSEFLSIVGIDFNDNEILSQAQECQVDVQFRECNFQIKELTDPNSQRGMFYKKIYNSVKSATNLEEVSLIGEVEDIPSQTIMYDIIVAKSKELSYKDTYIYCKDSIDLLFYVTRRNAATIQKSELMNNDFSEFGWRSISCVNSKQVVVLFANLSAPKFIQHLSQNIISKKY